MHPTAQISERENNTKKDERKFVISLNPLFMINYENKTDERKFVVSLN
jgi:hypothetical protein